MQNQINLEGVEVDGQTKIRTAEDINREILAAVPVEAVGSGGGVGVPDNLEQGAEEKQGGIDETSGGATVRTAAEIFDQWLKIANVSLRVLKAFWAPNYKIKPAEYEDASVPVAKLLKKWMPDASPESEEVEALLAVVSMFGAHGDEERFPDASKESANKFSRYFSRIAKALIGR